MLSYLTITVWTATCFTFDEQWILPAAPHTDGRALAAVLRAVLTLLTLLDP